jgi:hypothetical protein
MWGRGPAVYKHNYKKSIDVKKYLFDWNADFSPEVGLSDKKNFSAKKGTFSASILSIRIRPLYREIDPYDTLHFNVYKVRKGLYELHGDQDSFDLLQVNKTELLVFHINTCIFI